jgi:hypothetical protein
MSGADKCPGCGGDGGDNHFDRSICPCADAMHTRCNKCGWALDGCAFDKPASPLRGVDTDLGQAGYCSECHQWVPEGHDLCLGEIEGVSHACCGHGVCEPYVVIGGVPNQDAETIENPVTLRGDAAVEWFAKQREAKP